MNSSESTNKYQFYTPEKLVNDHGRIPEPRRGVLLIASCASGSYMARRVVEKYRQLLAEAGSCDQVLFLENVDTRFSDSETLVRLSRHVGGYDVFLFQALSNPNTPSPVDQNYMAFLIAARAFREHGAKHVTGVLPYLAYARQDKPTKFMREPTTAKLMADLGTTAGIDRLIVWDPHSAQIHGFYGKTPVAMLDSLALFVNQFRHFEGRDDVIVVAPDAGASKFVTHFSRVLGIRSAIASKFRPHPEEVTVSDIIGDFRGKKIAVVLDDMISSAGTIYEVIKKLVVEKRVQEVYLGVSHNLCVGKARERLSELNSEYNLKEVVITNSIPQTEEFKNLPFVTVKCLSDSLSRTINRIHYDRSVSEVFNVGEKE